MINDIKKQIEELNKVFDDERIKDKIEKTEQVKQAAKRMTQSPLEQITAEIRQNKESIILVIAGAGTGKTTLLKKTAEEFKNKKFLYLAYNASAAASAKESFPSNVNTYTFHALAKKIVESYIGKRLSIKEEKIEETDLLEVERDNTKLEEIERDLQSNNKLTFNQLVHLLKFILTGEYSPNGVLTYEQKDVLMVDEANDLNPIYAEIVSLLKAKVKIIVGDPNQSIYRFNDTIDFTEKIKPTKIIPLLTTYRLPHKVAKIANKIIKDELNGRTLSVSHNKKEKNEICYLFRGNKGVLKKAQEFYTHYKAFEALETMSTKRKKGYTPLFNKQKAVLVNVLNLSRVIKSNPKLCKDKEFIEYLKKGQNTNKVLLSTVHSSKGLEFSTVILSEEYINKYKYNKKRRRDEQVEEELKIFYVAVTRAYSKLLVEEADGMVRELKEFDIK